MRFVLRGLGSSIVGVSLAVLVACSDSSTSPGPTAPANLQVQATGASTARVTFSAVSGATSYIVDRAPGVGGTFAQVGTLTSTTFDDTNLEPNTAYRYRVATVVGTRQSAFSAERSVTTLAAGSASGTISSDITASRTLYVDTVYTLTGFIHVASGATLTIQAGTKIVGDFNVPGSSLFVLPGAKIVAIGTPSSPIVFTSSRPVGSRQPGDWGGLIIIGRGIINRGGSVVLEGSGTGPTNPQVLYSGGSNNADDSGELRYVRVEFAGYATAPDQELNSFTFAAVGSATKLSYLQSMAGLDDAFEWFGGAVDAKYLVSYETGDDHFDASEGFVGRNQFLIGLQTTQIPPRPAAGSPSIDPQGIENDGCNGSGCSSQAAQPFTLPLFANFTLIGTGSTASAGSSGGVGMMLRRGTAGYYVNGLVARWPRAAISLRDQTTKDRIDAGDLTLSNILLAENAVTFQPQVSGSTTLQFSVDEPSNAIVTSSTSTASLFTGLPASPANAAAIDWAPATGSAAASGGLATFSGALATRAGAVVSGTSYRGAADPSGTKWWAGWTIYAQN